MYIPNAIDIYIVHKLSEDNINGQAVSTPGRAFAIRKDVVIDNGRTMAHEMGHCLGLFHTYETAFGPQLLNNSNCDIHGDLVCDTPADTPPQLNVAPPAPLNTQCTYTGGGGFTPLENNIMSAYRDCRNQFTAGQAARIFSVIPISSMLPQRLVPGNLNISNVTYPQPTCSFCPPPISTAYFVAKNTISTSGNVVIQNNADVRFLAENEIVLSLGFRAENGSIFIAKIGPSCVPNFNRSGSNSDDEDELFPLLIRDEILRSENIEDETDKNDTDIKKIKLFPNPTNEVLNIDLEEERFNDLMSIEIIDVLGKRQLVEIASKVDVKNLTNGFYQIKFMFKDGNVIVKNFVKN